VTFRRALASTFIFASAAILLPAGPVLAVGVPPPGFVETVVTPVVEPTAFDWEPDGTLWIASKQGDVYHRIDGDPNLMHSLHLNVNTNDEGGIIGLVVDNDFANSPYIYLYYTLDTVPRHNRLSRFRVSGTLLVDEQILLELPELTKVFHYSGCLRFGLDGMLYVSVGDNGRFTPAADKGSLLGKMLRLNKDGTVPGDNPFVNDPNAAPQVWAYGFRNPWRYAVQPVTGALFVGDVGDSTWEEISVVVRGGHHGYPTVEGPQPPNVPGVTYPIYFYNHNFGSAAVTAGDFVPAGNFPPEYEGNFIFGDSSRQIIWRMILDSTNQVISVSDFITNAGAPVHMRFGPDGALYYASFFPAEIRRVEFVGGSNRQPIADASGAPTSGTTPLTVTFDGSHSYDPDGATLSYLWAFGDGTTSTSPTPLHTYGNTGIFNAQLTVGDGTTSAATTVHVVSGNRAPNPVIDAPASSLMFNAGDVINYAGNATDPEDGALSSAALRWSVIFHHDTHTHPFIGPLQGISGGQFMAADTGEISPDIWYEVRLTATDTGRPLSTAGAVSTTRTVSIFPRTSTFTLATSPLPDLELMIDGRPFTAPSAITGVVNFKRDVSAISPQMPGDGHSYVFRRWSDAGAPSHTISTPAANTTYTAYYVCDVLVPATNLTVTKAPAGQITLTWDAASDSCLAVGSGAYRIYRATGSKPQSPPGSFPADPLFLVLAATDQTSITMTPGPGAEYYLVVPVGSDGYDGPVGHYGQ